MADLTASQVEGSMYRDFKWSGSEKKIAQRAFEAARESVLAGIMAEFKAKAAAAATVVEMWAVEDYLRDSRQQVQELLDYRYSVLLMVFARLIREGHMDEGQLAGLAAEKLEMIRQILSL
jgi:hypothetical protein